MRELRIVAVTRTAVMPCSRYRGAAGAAADDDRLRIVAAGGSPGSLIYGIRWSLATWRSGPDPCRRDRGDADAAGVPIEQVRFQGPVLAERAHRAQEARARPSGSPGTQSRAPPRRHRRRAARQLGGPPRRPSGTRASGDNSWQVQLMFTIGGRTAHGRVGVRPTAPASPRPTTTPPGSRCPRLTWPHWRPSRGPRPGYGHSHRQWPQPRAACPAPAPRRRPGSEPAVSGPRSPPGPHRGGPGAAGGRGTLTTRC
jgi:hypothetical protein